VLSQRPGADHAVVFEGGELGVVESEPAPEKGLVVLPE
jgi:hypothetical protein